MIPIPIEIGDTVLVGRFKNRKMVVKEIGKDEHGHPTINGKKLLTMRIQKLMDEEKTLDKAEEIKKKREKIKDKLEEVKGVKQVHASKEGKKMISLSRTSKIVESILKESIDNAVKPSKNMEIIHSTDGESAEDELITGNITPEEEAKITGEGQKEKNESTTQ